MQILIYLSIIYASVMIAVLIALFIEPEPYPFNRNITPRRALIFAIIWPLFILYGIAIGINLLYYNFIRKIVKNSWQG